MAVAAVVALFLLLPAAAFADTLEQGLRRLADLLGGDARRAAADLPWDKIVHAVLFAGLAWVWCRQPARAGRIRGVLLAALGAVAYGGAIELCQVLLGYRAGEWTDLAADAIGVVAGAVLAMGIRPRHRR